MSYRNGYRQRSGSRPTGGQGSRWMQVHYPGTCKVCGGAVAAGETAYWDAAARTLTCYRIDCAGADGLTERAGRWAGNPDGVLSRRAYRVGTPAPQRAGGSAGVIATTFSGGRPCTGTRAVGARTRRAAGAATRRPGGHGT